MSTETPLLATQQYIDAFNRGDTETMAAIFDITGQILDGLPPHAWQGPTVTLDWYKDVMEESELLGATNYFVTIGEPLHNNATTDRAYIVVPATMTFDFKGAKVVQSGAFFTVALKKTVNGWRIVSWAWTKGANKNQ
jgi:hypothetical protein